MAQKTLEKVLKKDKDIMSIVEATMQKFLGVSIDELSKDLSTELEKPFIPLLVDPSLSFKEAKKRFREGFTASVLRKNYGNISEAAKLLGVDRRSIHRLVKDARINVNKIREDMPKPYIIKQREISAIIEDVLGNYRQVIHPEKLREMYRQVSVISDDLLKEIPEKSPTMKEAEEHFERDFIRKSLDANKGSVTKTARALGLRYETLHRKIKRLGVSI